jgi:hypothetical protein
VSVAGISPSSLYQFYNSQAAQTMFQKTQSEFQQLGKDLQAGNLTQAQQDFAALTQNAPAGQQSSPVAQALNTLGKDLQAGNLPAAQQDFATVQQDVQQAASQVHHHHHRHGGGAPSANSTSGQQSSNAITQDLSTLGQALQSGNTTAAQQAYATLQADFQQAGLTSFFGSSGNSGSQSIGATLNVLG